MTARRVERPDSYKPVRRPVSVEWRMPYTENIIVRVKASYMPDAYPTSFSSIKGRRVTELKFPVQPNSQLVLGCFHSFETRPAFNTPILLLHERTEKMPFLKAAMAEYRKKAGKAQKGTAYARKMRRKWDRVRKALNARPEDYIPRLEDPIAPPHLLVLLGREYGSVSRIAALVDFRTVPPAIPSRGPDDIGLEVTCKCSVKNLASEDMHFVSSPEGDFFEIGRAAFISFECP